MFFLQNLFYQPCFSKQKPLQGLLHTRLDQSKRTSQSASNKGSMTIEAAIVLPILLCVLMGIIMWGKLFLLSQGMDTALLETARQITRKEHILTAMEQEGKGILLVPSVFRSVSDKVNAWEGISVSSLDFSGSEYNEATKELFLIIHYKVKIPMFLLGTWQVPLVSRVKQKAWNGYAILPSEKGNESGGGLYITQDGEAYHKDGACYHLHITVREVRNTRQYYQGDTSLRPCEYCVDGQGMKSVLYVTTQGECFHEASDCSGLTRRVFLVSKDETEGRVPCADCCR